MSQVLAKDLKAAQSEKNKIECKLHKLSDKAKGAKQLLKVICKCPITNTPDLMRAYMYVFCVLGRVVFVLLVHELLGT